MPYAYHRISTGFPTIEEIYKKTEVLLVVKI